MKTIIIGKNSNLSKHLKEEIEECVLISSRKALLYISILNNFKDDEINLIFNNFQPAIQLGVLDNPEQYINNSILSTAAILEYFKKTKINKIIYTSSASVYGSNSLCSEDCAVQPMGLHASLKVANEMLVQKFCKDRAIDYTIARIFTMYGGSDNFSIVGKIIDAIQNLEPLLIINKGKAIRDYIHVNDVTDIYEILLKKKNIPI